MGILVAILVEDQRLERVSRELAKLGLEPPPIYHVTILFLGDVTGTFLRKTVEIFQTIDVETPRYAKVVSYDFLPPSSPRNVALVLDRRGLDKVREAIEKSMPVAKRDRYSFLPHVTIGRKRRAMSSEEVEVINKLLEEMRRAKALPKEVKLGKLTLIESSRGQFKILATK